MATQKHGTAYTITKYLYDHRNADSWQRLNHALYGVLSAAITAARCDA